LSDVDDLEEIGNLPMYIQQTQCVLFFLSKGYFFSQNCQKEIEATLDRKKPIILLHESDPNRGGEPLSQFLEDCQEEWRRAIFLPKRPVITWMRAKEFKMVSLKMLVGCMLHHQSIRSKRALVNADEVSMRPSQVPHEPSQVSREPSRTTSRARVSLARFSSKMSSFEVRSTKTGNVPEALHRVESTTLPSFESTALPVMKYWAQYGLGDEVDVVLHKPSAEARLGLGLALFPGDVPHPRVSTIADGGIAAASGSLFVRDVIVCIDGASVATDADAGRLLAAGGNDITLTVRRQYPAAPPGEIIDEEGAGASRGGGSLPAARVYEHAPTEPGSSSLHVEPSAAEEELTVSVSNMMSPGIAPIFAQSASTLEDSTLTRSCELSVQEESTITSKLAGPRSESPPSLVQEESTITSRNKSNKSRGRRRSMSHAKTAATIIESDDRWEPTSTLGSDLYIPGEVTRQHIAFLSKITLVISEENVGASELAKDMMLRYPSIRFEPHHRALADMKSHSGSDLLDRALSFSKSLGEGGSWKSGKRRRRDRRRKAFLLYLNEETWRGEKGSLLADHVRKARGVGVKIVLAHETDPAKGGCEFNEFFRSTPSDLVTGGLYSRIAVAFHPGQHRLVSYCLLAKDLGGVRSRFREVLAMRVENNSKAIVAAGACVRDSVGRLSRRQSSECGFERSDSTSSIGSRLSSRFSKRKSGFGDGLDSPEPRRGHDDDAAAFDRTHSLPTVAELSIGRQTSDRAEPLPSAPASELTRGGDANSGAGPSGTTGAEQSGTSADAPLGRTGTKERIDSVLTHGSFPDDPKHGPDEEEQARDRRPSISLHQLVSSGGTCDQGLAQFVEQAEEDSPASQEFSAVTEETTGQAVAEGVNADLSKGFSAIPTESATAATPSAHSQASLHRV
jgi:hypothetical protein